MRSQSIESSRLLTYTEPIRFWPDILLIFIDSQKNFSQSPISSFLKRKIGISLDPPPKLHMNAQHNISSTQAEPFYRCGHSNSVLAQSDA